MIALLLLAAEPVWVGQFAGSGTPPSPWRVVHMSRKVPPTLYRVAIGRARRAMLRSARASTAATPSTVVTR